MNNASRRVNTMVFEGILGLQALIHQEYLATASII